ncbi:unnamed protein product, partial [marine sediment metagenome]
MRIDEKIPRDSMMTKMDSNNLKIKRVVLFHPGLYSVGGGERLLFEEARYLKRQGI